jgi:hypothetical protein
MNLRKTLFVSLSVGLTLIFLFLTTLFYSHFNTISAFPVTAWNLRIIAPTVLWFSPADPIESKDAFRALLYLKRVKKVIIAGVNPTTTLKRYFSSACVLWETSIPDDIILEKTLTHHLRQCSTGPSPWSRL